MWLVTMSALGRPPSLDDKRLFRSNLYKVSSDDLGEVVKVLEDRATEAIDKVHHHAVAPSMLPWCFCAGEVQSL
jgi:hypothetical protein